ncbi:telomeric repeat-binding factor 1 [Rhinophrynus dorsalis]
MYPQPREEKAKGPSFHEVAETATDWMFDFTFTRLCCCFIDDRLEECQRSSKIMEVLLEDMPVIDSDKNKMVLIAQFLIRVLEGKHLDVQFEADEKLTPLDSAIMVFSQIEEDEENLRNLHEEINLFLKFQYMRMKFSAIISRRDTYNEFLQNFSYEKMLQKIKNYINLTLNGKQPAFLLKMMASKSKLSKPTSPPLGDTEDLSQEVFKTECENKENVKSLSRKKPSQPGALRKRKTWTETEDEQLMKGVELYGVGNWSKILSHYNFGSRTGVMLKDRWRTMKKLNIV